MTAPSTKIPKAQTQEDDGIHDYSRRVVCCKQKLKDIRQGDVGIHFLEKLHLCGLEDGRIIVYGARLPQILKLFNKDHINIADATKADCERVL